MTHSAKRITQGQYEYRGHMITRVEMDSVGCTPASVHWDVHHNGQLVDAAHTLREAKRGIDIWIDERG
jgi:murein DD-endopeptidase MepM/ murein hydrolase activator NlpD